jgi:YHS domain-containing protein/thiol-disulfide isomerase/thioredoxin
MRVTSAIGACTLLLLAAGATAADQDVWQTDFDQALAEAQRLNRPLLIHFYADWCGPCKQMESNVLHQDAVLKQIQRYVVAVKINTDRAPQVMKRYAIDTLPTDLFVEPDGRPMLISSGYRSQTEYLSSLSRAATRYTDLLASRKPAQSPGVTADPSTPVLVQDGNSGGAPGDSAATQEPPATLAAAAKPAPMLDGYCPVTLWKNRKWEKGSPQFEAEHRGQTYRFVSDETRQEFLENAERYAPRFLGCDAIVVFQSDRAVPGDTKYGAFYDDELYLFVNNENRQTFKKNPDRYIRTKVVLNVDQIETIVQ